MSLLLRRIVLLILLPVVFSGCFLAPAIDSFKRLGVTRDDRMRLLAPQVKKFEESMSWDDSSSALAMVDEKQRVALSGEFRRQLKSERVVDHKIVNLEFSDDAYTATAEVVVRAFKVPYYVVRERTELQKWRFNVSDGWKLTGREEKLESENPPA